eukprot:TRINITY_DN83_c0_g1_i1.p1 TRINITY_DN83_c0_g1~~TRINITY_DN83_c0_g1_i1.p1  ORF type:complete len:424 (-),score=71.94 TRINITY_DN83_c0_g1_i1:393-1628(-)
MSSTSCRYGAKCRKGDCHFSHPEGWNPGAGRDLSRRCFDQTDFEPKQHRDRTRRSYEKFASEDARQSHEPRDRHRKSFAVSPTGSNTRALELLKDVTDPVAIEWAPVVEDVYFWKSLPRDNDVQRGALIAVMAGTLKASMEGRYVKGDQIVTFDTEPSRSGTVFHSSAEIAKFPIASAPAGAPAPIIRVLQADTVDVGLVLQAANPTSPVAILNLASYQQPGGGFRWGSKAQEECIFRRTAACAAMDEEFCKDRSCALSYPVSDVTGCIWCPHVFVLREGAAPYAWLAQPIAIDTIAMAAVRKPRLRDGKFEKRDYELTVKKVDAIFRTAIWHGVRQIVLGALGCGAYGNPPEQVAEIFAQAMAKYAGYFDVFAFAILDGDGKLSGQFARTFGVKVEQLRSQGDAGSAEHA